MPANQLQQRFFMGLKYNNDQWLFPQFIKLPLCTPCEVFIFHQDPELSFLQHLGGVADFLSLNFLPKPLTKERKKTWLMLQIAEISLESLFLVSAHP